MRSLIAIIILAALACCQYDSINQEIPTSNNYLPLQVGNYWNFQSTWGAVDQARSEVVAIDTINNLQYYLLINTATYNGAVSTDSVYYHIDTNGYVYTYHKNESAFNDFRLRLNANDKDSWTYTTVDGSNQAEITVTVRPMMLGNYKIAASKSYYFDILHWQDEESTLVLAPGIGFVESYSNWGAMILKSAKINGQVFIF